MTFKEYVRMKKAKKEEHPIKEQDGTSAQTSVDGSEPPRPGADSKSADAKTAGREKAAARKPDGVAAEQADGLSEVEALRDKLLRLHADFDNFRKRMARDHMEMIKRANSDLIESLLPVLDHIGHAEAMMARNADAAAAPYLEGFDMVKNELLRVLEEHGVKPIETQDARFDANLHEALTAQHSDTAEAGSILFEVRRGYLLNGRVLRASQVIVAADGSGPAAEAEAPEAGHMNAAPDADGTGE